MIFGLYGVARKGRVHAGFARRMRTVSSSETRKSEYATQALCVRLFRAVFQHHSCIDRVAQFTRENFVV